MGGGFCGLLKFSTLADAVKRTRNDLLDSRDWKRVPPDTGLGRAPPISLELIFLSYSIPMQLIL